MYAVLGKQENTELASRSACKRAMLPMIILGFLYVTDANARQFYVSGGAGAMSCGTWLGTKADADGRIQFLQWLHGFLSGTNYGSLGAQARPIDDAGITAFIDQYCESNPLKPVVAAAIALVDESGGPKAEHQWKK